MASHNSCESHSVRHASNNKNSKLIIEKLSRGLLPAYSTCYAANRELRNGWRSVHEAETKLLKNALRSRNKSTKVIHTK